MGRRERERERDTPGGILDHRALRGRGNMREKETILTLRTLERRDEQGRETIKEQDCEGEPRREDRCSRQFRSRVSTCPPSSSTPLIIQI